MAKKEEKRGRGRPEKSDAERRKPAFLVLLTDAEHETVKKAADGKVSTWAREALLRAARRRVK